MTPREIIAKSWAITKQERILRRWGYASAFFETTRTVLLFLYQGIYFYYWIVESRVVGWFSIQAALYNGLPFGLFLTLLILLGTLLVLQAIVPTLASGAIIGLAAKTHRGEERRGGLIIAVSNLFKLLEIHGLFLIGDLVAMIIVGSLVIRYFGDVSGITIVIMTILWLLGMIFHFFANFAEEGVVIRKLGVFRSVGRSFKLILSYIGHIVFILILLFVISLRILLNALMIVLIPGIAIGFTLLLTYFLTPAISYTLGGLVGIILIIITSYFFAYLTVFMQTVWVITYIELSEQKDLDVIMEGE